ncbi:MAG: hypothetical protein A2W61_01930 [Deltaproteobacteria bacterium RIFCSPLOWO2_01_44_7]|nr:MAG: hypothetical protein A2712_10725 [Deltaproteobacteria bacterium RIFCSPHIGHO2_01_FULL_43_49]OGQ16528.1 MAG: hypothetical protein A3D22_06425 [Deltaproteobacteria bacterium RIFCSPHIGHO2_02_FULL_44_53]OGQ28345.1 MAG: hypothetical protein A3D98_06130 [Deltaproteobacteria bacterium RIFCSPHIGHO2_12_FULL_44_21]OGQ32416.1 MAG: hypothetical protein A2979_10690 [Deltaproteobacteria bacterium RIFCSPLOWO2_01_FULL_45_74]OGQ38510.1 MAG: hypothetical protein A2W61_01930 [Deltaproteobacteria bacterium 
MDHRTATPIHDPNPARRKRLTEKFLALLSDKTSLAELKGFKKEQLYLLAEAGHVKLKHGRLDEAEKIFQALILLDHRNSYFHACMGAVHQKKMKPVEAIIEYSQALSIDSKDVTSLVNRGEIYLRHKNYRKAAEDFRNAILLDLAGKSLWANRARSLVIAIKRSMEAEFARTSPQPRG